VSPDSYTWRKEEQYRLRAREILKLAQGTPSSEVREQLIQLAIEYVLMAEHAERLASTHIDAGASPIISARAEGVLLPAGPGDPREGRSGA
jgi:hypothetical protein